MAIFALLALGLFIPLVMDGIGGSDEIDEDLSAELERSEDLDPLDVAGLDTLLEDEPQTELVGGRYTSGQDNPDGFNIDLFLGDDWTPEQQQAILSSAEFLSNVVLRGVPDVVNPATGQIIDDLQIFVELDNFEDDEVNGFTTLGEAQLLALREGSELPFLARISLSNEMDIETFRATALHEMIHALGIGLAPFTAQVGASPEFDIPRFTGDNAIEAYATEFAIQAANDPNSALGVPVTRDGGHWDETLFGTELLTPVADYHNHIFEDDHDHDHSHEALLSNLTLAALEDIGYDTIWDDRGNAVDATGRRPLLAAA